MLASISPREKALAVLTYWWVIAGAAILGGLAGLAVFLIKQPIFEAQAHFTMGIDFSRTGYMEQYDKDLALGTAAGVVYSTDVMNQVIQVADAANIPVDFNTLLHSATFERKAADWTLRLRLTNPDHAAMLANQWVDLGVAALNQAYGHAVAADNLKEYIDSLASCLQQVTVNAVVPLCPFGTVGELQQALTSAESQYASEKLASRNVFPGVTYTVSQYATTPSKPVLYGRNNLVVAGLLIGLIAGLIVVSAGLPARYFPRK